MPPARLGFSAVPRVFYHGTAGLSVPAGHYYAAKIFCCGHGFSAAHIVVVPQFKVGTATTTTLHLSERSAISRIAVTRPRAVAVRDEELTVLRVAGPGAAAISRAACPLVSAQSPPAAWGRAAPGNYSGTIDGAHTSGHARVLADKREIGPHSECAGGPYFMMRFGRKISSDICVRSRLSRWALAVGDTKREPPWENCSAERS